MNSNLQREVLKNSNNIEAVDRVDHKDHDSPNSPVGIADIADLPTLPKNSKANVATVSFADEEAEKPNQNIRPPIDYTSFGAFWQSTGK